MINLLDIELTEDEKQWFGDRMDESATGSIKVPAHLYAKFKKIADNPYLKNSDIKDYLIDHCYI